MKKIDLLNKKISIDLNREVDLWIALPVLIVMAVISTLTFDLLRDQYFDLKHADYYDLRIEALKSELAKRPGDARTTAELAMVFFLDGQQEKAIKLAREVYQDVPGDKMVRLYLGLMLSDSGQAKEAVEILSKLSNEYPGYQRDQVLFYIGKSMYDMGLYSEAEVKFSACVQYNPGLSKAFLYLGKCREQTQDKQGALNAYQQVLKADPKQEEALQAVRRLKGS